MALVIAVVSQKGGVGKSTVARLIAREYAEAGWNVKIADLDTNQSTSHDWHLRRLQHDLKPDVPVERFRTVDQALKVSSAYDLLVIDGKPHSSAETLKMVEPATLAVLPSGVSIEDLKPQVLLAHELTSKGVPASRVVFAITRAGDSAAEVEESRAYIREAGYDVLPGEMPEKTGFRKANREGRSPTETRFPSLNERAALLAQGIVDRVTALSEAEGAAANG